MRQSLHTYPNPQHSMLAHKTGTMGKGGKGETDYFLRFRIKGLEGRLEAILWPNGQKCMLLTHPLPNPVARVSPPAARGLEENTGILRFAQDDSGRCPAEAGLYA